MSSFFRLPYVLAALLVLVLGEQALAWGPATHVALGNAVLSQLAVLPAAVAGILARHALAYLYGNIAADIVFAKRLSRVKQFCHHWSTGLRVLTSARDDRGRAFGYGYLSHLAADTVAHGKYVPRQVVLSGCSVNFGHLYWELRADATQPSEVWGLVQNVMDDDHEQHHAELSCHLTDTLLSYEVNRLLFERMNAFAARRTVRRTVSVWNQFSRFELPGSLMRGYQNECVDRIMSVLSEGTRSAVLRDDPNGSSALMHVKDQRRRDRRSSRLDRAFVERRRQEVASGWAPRRFLLAGVATNPPLLPVPSASAAGLAPAASLSTAIEAHAIATN